MPYPRSVRHVLWRDSTRGRRRNNSQNNFFKIFNSYSKYLLHIFAEFYLISFHARREEKKKRTEKALIVDDCSSHYPIQKATWEHKFISPLFMLSPIPSLQNKWLNISLLPAFCCYLCLFVTLFSFSVLVSWFFTLLKLKL